MTCTIRFLEFWILIKHLPTVIQTAEGTSLRRKERWRKRVQEMEVRQTGELGEREPRRRQREAQRSSGKGRVGSSANFLLTALRRETSCQWFMQPLAASQSHGW